MNKSDISRTCTVPGAIHEMFRLSVEASGLTLER